MCEKLFTGRARRGEPVPGPVSRSGPGSPLSSVCPYSAKSGRPGRAGDSRYSEFVQISHTLLCAEIGGNQNDEIGAGQGRDRLVAQVGPVRQPSDIDWRCYWPTVGAALAQFRSRILECENGWRQTKWTERFRFCSISGGLCLDAALSSCDSLDRGMLGAWGTHRAQALYAVSAQYRDTLCQLNSDSHLSRSQSLLSAALSHLSPQNPQTTQILPSLYVARLDSKVSRFS